MHRLKGRVAVVTGAASGIGFAIAQHLLGEGVRVVMTDLDGSAVTDAASAIVTLRSRWTPCRSTCVTPTLSRAFRVMWSIASARCTSP